MVLFLMKIAVAAAKEVEVCPDGKDQPPGVVMSRSRGKPTKGRGRWMTALMISLLMKAVSAKESKAAMPSQRVSLKISKTILRTIQIRPPLPSVVSSFMTGVRKSATRCSCIQNKML